MAAEEADVGTYDAWLSFSGTLLDLIDDDSPLHRRLHARP